jgi:L-amino acid N-acyltransferase
MHFSVRDATETDLSDILAIYNEAILGSLAVFTEQETTLEERQSWFALRTRTGYPVLVAESTAGSVLGFSTFGDFRAWPGYRHTVEHSVYVRSDMRRRGLGLALVEPLIARAESLDKHVMIAGIEATNGASIVLHERMGFRPVGVMLQVGWKFGQWLDLLFMQRMLGGQTAA